jgi:cytoskeletal protein RodZ
MGLPRFIKLPTHNRFNYSPRYWDPEKEEREERIRQIKHEMGIKIPTDPTRTTIKRGSFRQASKKTKVKATRSSNIRLVIILGILLFLAYLILFR